MVDSIKCSRRVKKQHNENVMIVHCTQDVILYPDTTRTKGCGAALGSGVALTFFRRYINVPIDVSANAR